MEHWRDNDSKVVSDERNSFLGQLHYASNFPTPHAVENADLSAFLNASEHKLLNKTIKMQAFNSFFTLKLHVFE